MSAPVTVSITRAVDPDRVPEVTRWVQSGVNLANTWPGFLGSGWVRESASSDEWHMLYRFDDAETLDAWENSGERSAWLDLGRGMVEERRVNRRTGIEGWFDAPSATTELGSTEPEPQVRPPRWKQAISIWLGFFPVNLAFTLLAVAVVPGWDDLWTLAKVFITTIVLTPIMAYWVLPFVTRALQPWLNRAR
ncbi:antibiotic biosynthesis monooxygenase [Marisediminicola senii]|uniref:antibiotic biosynthesis monooxygenase n=1 Tax=Marisediminicola senii TaxID=2711233 RepID=UPI0013E9B624|nr:antibiotic biosynthesis monooxygenase [Marisediminicola senii]